MKFLATRARNPFDMDPPCEPFVPGYGATDADFHVVGDHPGIHGGIETGIPFTGTAWSDRFLETLVAGEILSQVEDGGERLEAPKTFLSYLHMCEAETTPPTEQSYADMEPFFDAEVRAITAHVLFPVGQRATEHVLRSYTAIEGARAAEMDELHAEELHGAGWLVVPIKEPADWTAEDEEILRERLQALVASDYRQISDLGRFIPGDDPYFVR